MKIELTYHEENGIYYPDLILPEQTDYPIGKYGNLHLAFLKKHRRGTYMQLLSTGMINEYLHKIDLQTHETVRAITERLAHERGIDEALKSENPIRWVREMNNCKAAAEEVVLREVVYQ